MNELLALRMIIRNILLEAKKDDDLLGEPDISAERHREEPQPQYEEEEENKDEASGVAAVAGYTGPVKDEKNE